MIEIKSMSKWFGDKRNGIQALSDVSFSVSPGSPTALVGPNGSGKTTVLRILATTLVQTTGDALVDGYSVSRSPEQVRRRIGVVTSSERSFYFRLTGMENLVCFGTLYGGTLPEAKGRAKELLQLVGLEKWSEVLYMKYSLGLQRRLALARALFNDPPVLLLDEPTLGIDPESSKAVVSMMASLAEDKSVLYTSHDMNEVESVPGRVCILKDGRVMGVGTAQELASGLGLAEGSHLGEVFARLVGGSTVMTQSEPRRRMGRWHE